MSCLDDESKWEKISKKSKNLFSIIFPVCSLNMVSYFGTEIETNERIFCNCIQGTCSYAGMWQTEINIVNMPTVDASSHSANWNCSTVISPSEYIYHDLILTNSYNNLPPVMRWSFVILGSLETSKVIKNLLNEWVGVFIWQTNTLLKYQILYRRSKLNLDFQKVCHSVIFSQNHRRTNYLNSTDAFID